MSETSFNSLENLEDMDDPFNLLKKDLDNIYIPESLDNPSMMSSEFFDSVFSMEHSVFENENDNNDVLSNLDSDFQINSDVDDTRMTNSCSPDSATGYELNDYVILNDNVEPKTDDEIVNVVRKPRLNSNSILARFTPGLFDNNGSGKKVILSKPCVTKSNRKFPSNAKQVIRVQSLSGKGGSVLLPFNVANLKNIKIIKGKELQAENVKLTKVVDLSPQNIYIDRVSSPETIDDDDSDSSDIKMDQDRQYPALLLTDEEKRLLIKEGIFLPSHYPLTKQEEKDLKRIRRKIRNKISAQDSRKRKKEYVDGLEERIRQGAEEKKILLNRVKQLQKQNSSLIMQMNKLQVLVCNTTASKATPTASLLIVLLSVLLISLPNLRTPQDTEWKEQQQASVRRALLSSKASYEDVFNLEEFLSRNQDDETELKKMLFEDENSTEEFAYSNYIESLDKNFQNMEQRFLKDDNIKSLLDKSEVDYDIRNTFDKVKDFLKNIFDSAGDRNVFDKKSEVKKKFIEPDIDDDDLAPPIKRVKTGSQGVPSTVVVKTVQKE